EARKTARDDGMTKLLAADTKRDQDYTDYLHQLDGIQAHENYLSNQIDHLPPGHFDAANRVLQTIESGPPGSDTADKLRQLTTAVFNQTQGQSMAASAAAEQDAIAAQEHEAGAQGMEHLAIAAGILTGPLAIAAGAATAAQVGAINLVSQAVPGAGIGYQQGGLPGALWGVASATLPVNTLQAAYQATIGQVIDPNAAPAAGVGSIAMGFAKDVFNALTLSAVGIDNIGPAATPAVPAPSKSIPTGLARVPAPEPPPPPPPSQSLSRTPGTQGITDVNAFAAGVNGGGPSWKPVGYTKTSLFTDAGQSISPKDWDPITTATNCPNCALVGDAKLAGVPMPPAPPGNGLTPAQIETIFNQPVPPGAPPPAPGTLGGSWAMQSSREDIKNFVQQSWGPGSRGVVVASRGDDLPGHIFNVVNDGGTVKFIDFQSGAQAKFMGQGYVAFGVIQTGR
ncbi:toxin glutamine deamidase domain-containing protein, partial [Kitasatospora sp. NPDC101155]|uniref:toxin glutamine deamidase domain-containing protein n=1 Tax=Kitasatospora sp. NPDC101155 TaxID=3364097 RepID=UPI0038089981